MNLTKNIIGRTAKHTLPRKNSLFGFQFNSFTLNGSRFFAEEMTGPFRFFPDWIGRRSCSPKDGPLRIDAHRNRANPKSCYQDDLIGIGLFAIKNLENGCKIPYRLRK